MGLFSSAMIHADKNGFFTGRFLFQHQSFIVAIISSLIAHLFFIYNVRIVPETKQSAKAASITASLINVYSHGSDLTGLIEPAPILKKHKQHKLIQIEELPFDPTSSSIFLRSDRIYQPTVDLPIQPDSESESESTIQNASSFGTIVSTAQRRRGLFEMPSNVYQQNDTIAQVKWHNEKIRQDIYNQTISTLLIDLYKIDNNFTGASCLLGTDYLCDIKDPFLLNVLSRHYRFFANSYPDRPLLILFTNGQWSIEQINILNP
jgi:hypothetical protein